VRTVLFMKNSDKPGERQPETAHSSVTAAGHTAQGSPSNNRRQYEKRAFNCYICGEQESIILPDITKRPIL
jgi:hypothetical protein